LLYSYTAYNYTIPPRQSSTIYCKYHRIPSILLTRLGADGITPPI